MDKGGGIVKQLTKYSARYKYLQLYMLIASLVLSLAVVFQNIYLGKIINEMLVEEEVTHHLSTWLVVLLLILLLRACCNFLNQLAGEKLSYKVKRDIRTQLLHKHTKQSKLTIITEAIEGIHPFYESYLPQVFKSTVIPLSIIIALYIIHWPAAVIMTITAPFIPLFYIVFGLRTQDKAKDQMQSLNQFANEFIDLTKGLVSLKLFNRTEQTKEKINHSSTSFRDLTMDILKTAFLSGLMLEFISMLGIGIVALEAGLRLIVFHDISFLVAVTTLLLAPEFYNAIKDLGQAFHTGKQSEGYIEVIEEVNQVQEERVNPVKIDNQLKTNIIQLQNVNFHYDNYEKFNMKDISVNIKEGNHTAIIGASGSGKSTLVQLIINELNPKKGNILYKKDLTFGYLSQRPYIFSATLLENVTMFKNYDEQAVNVALNKVGLQQKVANLKNEIHTMIGDGYEMLSGGEMRRVELARILLLNPDVIIFDEPTTGLDVKTEQLIVRIIAELSETKTIITIAHRKEVLKHADTFIELKNGQIYEVDNIEQGGEEK